MGRGVRVGTIWLGVGVSVGDSGLGLGDRVTVDKGVAVGDARILVGDQVGATDTLHLTRDTSRTKSTPKAYRLTIMVFIVRVSYRQLPATANAIQRGILVSIYRERAMPAGTL